MPRRFLSFFIFLFIFPLFFDVKSIIAQRGGAPTPTPNVCGDLMGQALTDCQTCMGSGPTWVWTGIGCLQAGNPNQFIGTLLGWAVILGGGIAFVLIAVAGFQISTAAGDVKRVKTAQELLTSAIFGLLLIIFSIFLLNLVGLKILNLNLIGGPIFGPPNQ